MKLVSDICKEKLSSMIDDKPVLCHYIMTPWGPKLLDEPIMSMGYKCTYCGDSKHYTCWFDPKSSDKRMMFCGNIDCESYNHVKTSKAIPTQPPIKRRIEWALFCEINGIGDIDYSVKFENIEQSAGKIDYLTKFIKKPCGIIVMEGPSGSGKTYASMAACEAFTRFNVSCIFSTQEQMLKKWLEKHPNYEHQLEHANLLVVDDFGTGEISSGFMKFFLGLINTRMKWTDRGTIITTNLNDEKLSEYCGEALTDRLKTSQKFVFPDTNRRKKPIL